LGVDFGVVRKPVATFQTAVHLSNFDISDFFVKKNRKTMRTDDFVEGVTSAQNE